MTGVHDSIQPNPLLDLINFIAHPPGGSRADLKRQIEGNGIKLNERAYQRYRVLRQVRLTA